MVFTLPEDFRIMRDTVARFVKHELIPVEALMLKRVAGRGYSEVTALFRELKADLQRKPKAIAF